MYSIIERYILSGIIFPVVGKCDNSIYHTKIIREKQ